MRDAIRKDIYWGGNRINGDLIFFSILYFLLCSPRIHSDDESIGTFLCLPESSDPEA